MDIPKLDRERMLAMCRLRQDEELPKKVTDKYWAFKRCIDRIGERVMAGDLARICVECGYGKPLDGDSKGPTVADLFRKKQIPVETKVAVEWREDLAEGRLMGVDSSNQCLVILDGEVEVRKFDVGRVTMAA